jgi:hypothetical protein
MGEMIRETGTLIPFKFSNDNLTINEMIQELKDNDVDIDESDSVEFESITGNGVVTIRGEIFVIQNMLRFYHDDGYANITDNCDGTFNFDTSYYSGYGTTFLEEQLEYAFDEYDKTYGIMSYSDMNNSDSIKDIARNELISVMVNNISKINS